MVQLPISVIQGPLPGGASGDILYVDMEKVAVEYPYVGLWYAGDREDSASFVIDCYYGPGARRPDHAAEELTENSFRETKRYKIARDRGNAWFAIRVPGTGYGGIQLQEFQTEGSFMKYAVVRNRPRGIESLKSCTMKIGTAHFSRMSIEDGSGAVDYRDTTLFVVLLRELPPADWQCDHACLGVQGVPVIISTARFAADGTYAPWLGQNPLAGIS